MPRTCLQAGFLLQYSLVYPAPGSPHAGTPPENDRQLAEFQGESIRTVGMLKGRIRSYVDCAGTPAEEWSET